MSLIDIVILIMLLLSLWQGYVKGMMKSLVGLVGNLLALGIAYISYRPLGAMIDGSTKSISRLAEKLSTKIPLPDTLIQISADQSGVGQLYTYLEESKLPQSLTMSIIEHIQETVAVIGNNVLGSMREVIGLAIAEFIFYGGVFILVWIIAGVLIHLLSSVVIGAIQMIPLLGSIDRMGGAVVNGALFVLVLTVAYGLFNNFFELSKLSGIMSNTAFVEAMNKSIFLAFFGELFNSLWAILLNNK